MQNTPIRNKREPFFNDVPPGVLAVGSLLVVIEILLQILGLEWRSGAFLLFAFFPIEFSTPYKELFFGQNLLMFFSYSLLHGNFFHMIINVAILFALGKQIEERVGMINFILIFVSTAIIGAVAYQILASGNAAPMFMGTGIAEVALPVEFKLRNIQKTEEAKLQLESKRENGFRRRDRTVDKRKNHHIV